ncbi:MAG TPA: VOC family protein, partial [Terracidiphilus sp.]
MRKSLKFSLCSSVAIALGCSAISIAQPPPPNQGVTGIANVAFRVSDLDREIVFFGKLGYQEAFTLTYGKTTEAFIKINDHEFIELYPQTDRSQPLGWMHICYEAGDLNALQHYYATQGLNPTPVRKAAAGNLVSSVNDPEHGVTQFTQYLPGSRHTLDIGQHLGSGRISNELMGIDLPVRDGAAMKEFYSDLGFQAEDSNGNVRLTAPGAPDLHMELRQATPGA